MILWVLMIAPGGMDALLAASRALERAPVIMFGDASFVVRSQETSPELHVAIFASAGLPLQPAWAFSLEG